MKKIFLTISFIVLFLCTLSIKINVNSYCFSNMIVPGGVNLCDPDSFSFIGELKDRRNYAYMVEATYIIPNEECITVEVHKDALDILNDNEIEITYLDYSFNDISYDYIHFDDDPEDEYYISSSSMIASGAYAFYISSMPVTYDFLRIDNAVQIHYGEGAMGEFFEFVDGSLELPNLSYTHPKVYTSYKYLLSDAEIKSLIYVYDEYQGVINDFSIDSSEYKESYDKLGEYKINVVASDGKNTQNGYFLIEVTDNIKPIIYLDLYKVVVSPNFALTEEDFKELLYESGELNRSKKYRVTVNRDTYTENNNKEGIYLYDASYTSDDGIVIRKVFEITVSSINDKNTITPKEIILISYSVTASIILIIGSINFIKKRKLKNI